MWAEGWTDRGVSFDAWLQGAEGRRDEPVGLQSRLCAGASRGAAAASGASARQSWAEDEEAVALPRLLLWKTVLVCFSI